jgi:phage-related protein
MARLEKTIDTSNTIRTKNGTLQSSSKLQVFFYKSSLVNEPVKVWLKSLGLDDRKTIGEEIKLVQLGWPIGMPLVRNLRGGLWEIRIRLVNRIARVVFAMFEGNIVLLHGFIKKQQETPKTDLQLSIKRWKSLQKD